MTNFRDYPCDYWDKLHEKRKPYEKNANKECLKYGHYYDREMAHLIAGSLLNITCTYVHTYHCERCGLTAAEDND